MCDEPDTCRICAEEEEEGNILISPCNCIGGQLYVHTNCLNQWINGNLNKEVYHKCGTCNSKYVRSKPDNIKYETNRSMVFSLITIESGLFMIILFLILGVSTFVVITSIVLFMMFIFYLSFVCDYLRYNFSWVILVIYVFICLMKRKQKVFSVNLLLILSFMALNILLVIDRWDNIEKCIEKVLMVNFKSKMYDKSSKSFVDGVS